jgi:hypothetical protein
MAEMALKIRDGSGYEDGDVLAAFNSRRIRCVHAEHLCLPKFGDHNRRLLGMDGNGILPPGTLAQDWCELTQEYRLERLSDTEGRVIRMADAAEIRFKSGRPFAGFDGRIVSMDLPRFMLGKRRANLFPVFGKRGREIVYGGRIDVSDAKLTAVWQRIEAKTGKRPDDNEHRFWPAGRDDLKEHLFLPVEEMDDSEAERVVAPMVDETDPEHPVTVKRRAIQANNWRGILAVLGVTEADVLDRGKSVDKRRDVAPFNDRALLRDKRTNQNVPAKGPR